MRVLTLENGLLQEKEIENTLESLQKIVGGWIEIPYISHRFREEVIDVIINEEGKLIGLEPQIAVVRKDDNKILDLIAGNCIFASHDEEGNTVELTDKQIEIIKEELKYEAIVSNKVIKVLFV